MTPEQTIKQYLSKIGSKGGKNSSLSMTKEQRIERAKKAVQARIQKNKHMKTLK